MSGVPPRFPMIWMLFQTQHFLCSFQFFVHNAPPIRDTLVLTVFGAARLLRLALRAERPRIKTDVTAYVASAGTGSSDSSLPSGSRAGGSIDTRSDVTL